MNAIAVHMDLVDLTHLLEDQTQALKDAAQRRDLKQTSALDHRIRSTAMAILGAGAPTGQDHEAQRHAIVGAIDALMQAARILDQPARARPRTTAQNIYLAHNKKGAKR